MRRFSGITYGLWVHELIIIPMPDMISNRPKTKSFFCKFIIFYLVYFVIDTKLTISNGKIVCLYMYSDNFN